jgi:hypothetical protein
VSPLVTQFQISTKLEYYSAASKLCGNVIPPKVMETKFQTAGSWTVLANRLAICHISLLKLKLN